VSGSPVATPGRRLRQAKARTEERLNVPGLILVVDDDDPVRVMISRLLRNQGYTVLMASQAAEARAVFETQLPDLVISDIVMPGESGIELRRAVAAEHPGLPFILISGFSAEGPAEFAARTRDTWFLQKPFAVEDFLALVEEILGRRADPPGG